MTWRLLFLLLAVITLTGCLGPTYRVERHELARVAALAPDQRGAELRATQDLSFNSPAAEAMAYNSSEVALRSSVVVAGSRDHRHRPRASAASGVAGARRGTGAGRRRGGGGVAGSVRGPRTGSGGGGAVVGSVAGPRAGSGGSGGGGGGLQLSEAALDEADGVAVALVIIAVSAVALPIMLSEGLRYDGWLQFHPDHPIRLTGPRGEGRWIPISSLTPEWAAWAQEGLVYEGHGPITRLERAPLNRVGFNFGLAYGGAGLHSFEGDAPWAQVFRFNLGFFPLQWLGLSGGVGVHWGVASNGDAMVQWRPHMELQAYPLSLNPLHLGVYLQGGALGGAQHFGGRRRDLGGGYLAGGALLQLELSTRLALTLRAGVAWIDGRPGWPGTSAPEVTLGLDAY